MMAKEHTISFVTEATIKQTIIILDETITIDDIKNGLMSGTYLTSIDHDLSSGKEEYIYQINDDLSLKTVALIKKQEAEGDIAVYL